MIDISYEIYSKNQQDLDYVPDQLDISDEVQIYLNQIRNIFSAEPGAIMGAADMFVDLESYIYEMGLNEADLERVVTTAINKYASYASKYPTSVKVRFTQGTVRDIAFLDIVIDDTKRMELRIT